MTSIRIVECGDFLSDEKWIEITDGDGFELSLSVEAYGMFVQGGNSALIALVGLLKENLE